MSRLLVLGWHNVEATWCFPVQPGAGMRGLTRQLRWLRSATTVVPLQPALERLATGRRLPARAVALTFDDGYADNLDLASTALSGFGLPATFFLVPGLLDAQASPWWEELAWAFVRSRRAHVQVRGVTVGLSDERSRRAAFQQEAERLKLLDRAARDHAVEQWVVRLDPQGDRPGAELFLDWAGARGLVRRGFDVGSHSSYHAILSRETPEAQTADLVGATGRLRAELGVAPGMLAYPNGRFSDYDEATLAAAEAAGHRFAVTTQPGWTGPGTPRLEIRRSVVAPDWDLATTLREAWSASRAMRVEHRRDRGRSGDSPAAASRGAEPGLAVPLAPRPRPGRRV